MAPRRDEIVGPLLHRVPPKVGSIAFGDVLSTAKTAWSVRGLGVRGVGDLTRLFSMSISNLLDRWFESEQVKTAMMVDGLIGQWAGPDEPGTAYVLLHHAIGGVGGDSHVVNWGFPQGGMGSVADSIRDAAVAAGCEIRTGGRVSKIIAPNGVFRGVALENGDTIMGRVGVTSVHPQIAFLRMLDRRELPDDFVADIESWRSRSGVVKINLAISELPDFTADPGTDLQPHHTESVELCHDRAYAERAFQDAHLERRGASRPFVDGVDPLDDRSEPRSTRRAHLLDVQSVGTRRLDLRAASGRARGVRRPCGRWLQRACAQLPSIR